jgi:membrane-bound metal-dependent hydrolase YbcI (DUF457 family)
MFCQPTVSSVLGQSALLAHSYLGQTFRDGQFGREGTHVLWAIFAILLIPWLLGVVSFYGVGGFVALLLIIAVGVLLIRVIEGRRPLI